MLFCLTAFQVSFYCPGTTEGEVDMTFSLNYTRIVSGSVDTEEIKSFMLTVRRRCEKTGNWHWIRHYHFAFLQGFFFPQIPCLFRSVSYETFKQSLTENYSIIIIIVGFAFLLFTLMKQFLACLDRSFKIYFCSSIIIFWHFTLHPHEWPRHHFSFQYKYDTKQTNDEITEKCQLGLLVDPTPSFCMKFSTDGNDNFIEQVTSSPWSRSKVVGICAGLTTVIISVVGLVLLFRYCMRQRKLKIEFEDDVEMYRSSSSRFVT